MRLRLLAAVFPALGMKLVSLWWEEPRQHIEEKIKDGISILIIVPLSKNSVPKNNTEKLLLITNNPNAIGKIINKHNLNE